MTLFPNPRYNNAAFEIVTLVKGDGGEMVSLDPLPYRFEAKDKAVVLKAWINRDWKTLTDYAIPPMVVLDG